MKLSTSLNIDELSPEQVESEMEILHDHIKHLDRAMNQQKGEEREKTLDIYNTKLDRYDALYKKYAAYQKAANNPAPKYLWMSNHEFEDIKNSSRPVSEELMVRHMRHHKND